MNYIGSKSASDPSASCTWSLDELRGHLFDCCFTEHFMECPVLRFLFRAAFEGFSNTFWPQHHLENGSLGGTGLLSSAAHLPLTCLGYLFVEWPELPGIRSFHHPASRTTVSLWLSVLFAFTCLFPHLSLPTRHFSLQLQWGLSTLMTSAPCSRNSRWASLVWFLGLLSSHTPFVIFGITVYHLHYYVFDAFKHLISLI